MVHTVIVTNAAAINYPDEGEHQLSWNTIIEFRGPCERYLAACPFPEPAQSEQFELSVLPVPSPARRSSVWLHHWPQMKPGGPWSPRVGLVGTSVVVKVSSEDEVGLL